MRVLATLNGLYYIEYMFENGIEFNQAAFKHGINEADIRHAIRHFIYEEQIDDGDNNKHLILGFDTSRRLLEIMYNIIDEHTINIFHAMKCRKMWRSHVNL
jgi:hypothetical protein